MLLKMVIYSFPHQNTSVLHSWFLGFDHELLFRTPSDLAYIGKVSCNTCIGSFCRFLIMVAFEMQIAELINLKYFNF